MVSAVQLLHLLVPRVGMVAKATRCCLKSLRYFMDLDWATLPSPHHWKMPENCEVCDLEKQVKYLQPFPVSSNCCLKVSQGVVLMVLGLCTNTHTYIK